MCVFYYQISEKKNGLKAILRGEGVFYGLKGIERNKMFVIHVGHVLYQVSNPEEGSVEPKIREINLNISTFSGYRYGCRGFQL